MYRKLIYLVSFVLVLGLIGNASGQTGQILIEWWTGITGGDLNNLLNDANYPDNPSGSDFLTIFEVPDAGQKMPELADLIDNYGVRVRGYFHPPTTGDYTFWIISDDEGRLFLSPQGSSSNKVLIARVIRNTGWGQWDKYIGQRSAPVSLEAGKKYYIEAIYKEGTGGDRLRVAYGGDGAQVVIPGSELSPWNPGIATNPSPADGGNVGTPWAGLTWSAEPSAVEHHVYIGESYADVAAGTSGTDQGRQSLAILAIGLPGKPYPDGLTPGTTFYWRVDEVDGDGTIHTGEVWSFKVSPQTTSNPSPADGATFVDPDVELSWVPGFGAVIHQVFFGTDETEVANGTGDTAKGPVGAPTYTPPGPLVPDTTYYWRIDEFDGSATHTGDVWRFRTVTAAINDPNLVGWWKLDNEGAGTVIDYSGYGHHGTIHGDLMPLFHAGVDGEAMEFDDRNNQYVTIDGYKGVIGGPFSITAWIRSHDGSGEIVGWGSTGGANKVEFRKNSNRLRCEHNSGNVQGDTNISDNEWHHVAMTVIEGAAIQPPDVMVWLDGQDDTRQSTDTDSFTTVANFDVKMAVDYDGDGDWLHGALDDVRLYDKTLTQEEIQQIMLRPDPFRAWDPNPADGSIPDIEQVAALSWSPGEIAAQHDVYFGTDANAVAAADTSDTIDIYRGRQDANSYIPPEGVEMDQVYYWRIDELNTDGTISTGKVWTFTVGNFLIVDDMESYTNDVGNRIFQTWIDGAGFSEPAPGYPGNGTGSTVGNWPAPFAEKTIVNNGSQSMPISYTNDGSTGKALYSETESEWAVPQDWTRYGVKSLTLWLRGLWRYFGSFTEHPPVYTMTARGADIWATSDEFHYAYKRLSGAEGSIIAKVFSMSRTHNWAKAGVMIRETLAPDSAHAAVYITPNNGVSFEQRLATGDITNRDNQTGINYPYWVKLTRTGNTFTAEHSVDGATWETLGIPETIPMGVDVYIGLALTSHNVNQTCVADFYDVTMTGTVTGQWQSQDIGIASNTADELYVALEDAAGKSAVVKHENPNAVLLESNWDEWNIDLKDFTGVNLAAVKKISIGVGDRAATQPGGTGSLYIDDIRLYVPRCLPDVLKPAADSSDNCVVDYPDIEIMGNDWLLSGYPVTAEAVSDANLVAHYSFDGNTNDSTGANNGVVVGNATYVEGKIGQAIHFDFGYVAIENLYYESTGHPEVSVMAWIRTSNPDLQKIVSFDRDEYWRLGINAEAAGDGQVQWCVMTLVDGAEVQVDYGSTTRVDDGQWHHVAGVFDNGTLTIYIDGSAETPDTSGGITFGTGLTRYGFIGVGSEATVFNRDTGPEQYFDGDLDDVRIYSRALSHAEIVNLAGVPAGETFNQPLLPLLSTATDADLHDDEIIDLKDYALLVDTWLDELLWPAE